ncbi:MAG: response regulator transcription factor [Acidobacteria bacterium]|nr:response regulator transcription factor [Acidobacteriota bacterium]
MPIRTLLVDDEQPARDRLRQLLAAMPEIEVVGEAEDGLQAVERVSELAPDLLLLDIQMPGCSGLEVAASLGRPRPAIIFCTAYDQYAVDAFELHAMDYLLKPVNRARLQAALERVRDQRVVDREHQLDQVTRGDRLSPARFLARKAARFRIVPRNEVVAFTFQEGLTRLHTATEQLWMQPTLAALARRLDGDTFFQVSRTGIVSLDAVREAKPFPDGTGEVILTNGQIFPVTRRRWRLLMEQLEQ